jgi:hypothetical protein
VSTNAKLGIGISALAVAAVGIVFATNCGKSDEKSSIKNPAASQAAPDENAASSSASTSSAPQPKGPRGPIDPAKTGTITGVVAFEGTPPARKEIVSNSGGCPEHSTPLLTEEVIVENGKLANVFVHIKDGWAGWDLPPVPSEPVQLNQHGCQYLPHVLGMRTGGKVLVSNSDPTSHNVNVRTKASDAMNPIQPPGGKPVEWTPTKKELGVAFDCSLHPWMHAFVCVVDDPWFAITGADGSFTLAGVPPGDYVVEAWHEKYGKKTAKVSLEPGGSGKATFTFKPQ